MDNPKIVAFDVETTNFQSPFGRAAETFRRPSGRRLQNRIACKVPRSYGRRLGAVRGGDLVCPSRITSSGAEGRRSSARQFIRGHIRKWPLFLSPFVTSLCPHLPPLNPTQPHLITLINCTYFKRLSANVLPHRTLANRLGLPSAGT